MKQVFIFQVTYDGTTITGLIRKGDCGSPVADSYTGELYGHIISVSEDGKTAFVMSASDAFSAIKTEANIGRLSWSISREPQSRTEYSLCGDKLKIGSTYE